MLNENSASLKLIKSETSYQRHTLNASFAGDDTTRWKKKYITVYNCMALMLIGSLN